MDRGEDKFNNERAHYWEFSLDPATMDSTSADTLFHGMANVRLTEVRCWLIGLDSAADNTGHIKVHLTQMGEEMIVKPTGEIVPVTHDQIEKAFEYSINKPVPDPMAVVTPAKYWGEAQPGQLPELTPIGPFATWRVSLRNQDVSKQIKWDTLESIRMEFFVRWVAFKEH